MLTYNDIPAMTLADIEAVTGVRKYTLRQRRHRGSLDIQPFAKIGLTDLFRTADVRRAFPELNAN